MRFKSISSDLLVTIVTLVAAFAAVTAAMAFEEPAPGFERYNQAYPEPYAYPLAQNTARVSVASDGAQANGASYHRPSTSADGRYVAFYSYASNLVAGDTNGVEDVFVHDRQSGETSRISLASDGSQADDSSEYSTISANGRYVAFGSYASNLVAGDTNGTRDIFVHDRQTSETTCISLASDGTQANSDSYGASISADGRYVVFSGDASNLVVGDTNGESDVFIRDRQSGETSRISLASDGSQANSGSYETAISADGRYIAFGSYADNLVAGDANGKPDIFVHDRQTGETTRVSLASNGTQANDYSFAPSISADGRYVAFESYARNLVTGDTNGYSDIFVYDRQTSENTRASFASDGTQTNNDSYGASISADGRYVAFSSSASNLFLGDTNGMDDIFVHDRQSGATIRIPSSPSGFQINYFSYDPAISENGRVIAFTSYASNLVAEDTNGFGDVFVYDKLGKTAPANKAGNQPLAPTLSWNDDDDTTAGYEYCLGTARGNCNITDWTGTGSNTSVALSGLAPNTTYYWQVRTDSAIEADGGAWWSFTTAFGKTAPADGATNQPLSPTLSWNPLVNAASYEYCYSSVAGPCTKWNSVGANTSVILSGLAPNYTYYWQARAVTGNGFIEADNGGWWSFTTTSAPSCTFAPYTPPATPSFVDVPEAHWAWDWIERYYSAGLTTGCAWVPGGYCPRDLVTREQMAVFIMRAKNCGSYTPAAVTSPVFTDVPASHWAAGFIRDFANQGITTGCAWVPGGYCPGDLVTREQMAVFVIRATHGGTYSPPAVTSPVFTDVPVSHWAATFIKQFYDEGITTGCSWVPGGYCPGDLVTREQMAVFIGRAFNLP